MRGYGAERVTNALLSVTQKLRARAYLCVLPALLQKQAQDEAARLYQLEALRVISRNTAGLSQNGGYMAKSYYELVHPPKEETRSAEEIAASFLDYFGAKGGDEQ